MQKLLLLLTIITVTFANLAQADTRWYQVDVLIFHYEHDRSNEAWPAVKTHPIPKGDIVYLNQGGGAAYKTLDQRDYLGRYVTSLQRNGMHVVFQQVWKQPADSRIQMPFIRIDGGNSYGSRHELEGYLRISAQRFLHVDADLWWNEFNPAGSDNSSDDTESYSVAPGLPRYEIGRNFELKESRRMRSGEVHYLDSPVLGMLIRVTPTSP